MKLTNFLTSGVAIGVASTFRLLGGAIATAIYTAILTNQFAAKLPTEIMKVVKGTGFDMTHIRNLIKAAAVDTAAAYKAVPGITPTIIKASDTGVQVAYTQSYQVVYLAALAFGVLGLICGVFSKSTDRALKNASKAVLLENETFVQVDLEKDTTEST